MLFYTSTSSGLLSKIFRSGPTHNRTIEPYCFTNSPRISKHSIQKYKQLLNHLFCICRKSVDETKNNLNLRWYFPIASVDSCPLYCVSCNLMYTIDSPVAAADNACLRCISANLANICRTSIHILQLFYLYLQNFSWKITSHCPATEAQVGQVFSSIDTVFGRNFSKTANIQI